jgi:hypothetical protein
VGGCHPAEHHCPQRCAALGDDPPPGSLAIWQPHHRTEWRQLLAPARPSRPLSARSSATPSSASGGGPGQSANASWVYESSGWTALRSPWFRRSSAISSDWSMVSRSALHLRPPHPRYRSQEASPGGHACRDAPSAVNPQCERTVFRSEFLGFPFAQDGMPRRFRQLAPAPRAVADHDAARSAVMHRDEILVHPLPKVENVVFMIEIIFHLLAAMLKRNRRNPDLPTTPITNPSRLILPSSDLPSQSRCRAPQVLYGLSEGEPPSELRFHRGRFLHTPSPPTTLVGRADTASNEFPIRPLLRRRPDVLSGIKSASDSTSSSGDRSAANKSVTASCITRSPVLGPSNGRC